MLMQRPACRCEQLVFGDAWRSPCVWLREVVQAGSAAVRELDDVGGGHMDEAAGDAGDFFVMAEVGETADGGDVGVELVVDGEFDALADGLGEVDGFPGGFVDGGVGVVDADPFDGGGFLGVGVAGGVGGGDGDAGVLQRADEVGGFLGVGDFGLGGDGFEARRRRARRT